MARRPRIEYEGAAYHVMSRGNRGADIFVGDRDRRLFLETLEEAVERTAWETHAYVLMRNHYHFLVVTPHANLVEGMKWFQGTFTQRMNARHRWRGHLFQGRYKALNVDPEGSDGYFLTVANYIHLNPAEAGLVGANRRCKRLADYRWSSMPHYAQQKRRRPGWLRVDEVLACLQCPDTAHGRRRYTEYIEARARSDARPGGREGDAIAGRWYLGGESFRGMLLDRIEELTAGKEPQSIRGDGVREVGQRKAEALIECGLEKLGLTEADLGRLQKGDPRKQALAWLVRSRTMVPGRWVAERLKMGDPSNVSRAVGLFRRLGSRERRKLKRRLVEYSGFKD